MAAGAEALGAPLQRALRHAQDVVRHRDQAGSERERLLRFARWRHDEPYRLYNVQRDLLRQPAKTEALQRQHLEDVVQLARMGARPRDRVMLALRALWIPKRRKNLPRASNFELLRKEVENWLEEAQDSALETSWELTLRPRSARDAQRRA